MTTNASIKADIQKLMPGQLVELYNIVNQDETISYNFCNGTISGTSVRFGGVEYVPMPVETEGWETGGEGKQARPRIRVSNIYYTFLASTIDYADLIDWKVVRRRTFYHYLDGQPSAGANEFPTDTYYIYRKTIQNKYIIEWELSSNLDQGGKKVPSKQVLEMCQWRYRNYVSGAFNNASTNYTTDYDPEIQCPYKGTTYFLESNATTATASLDRCSHSVYGCKKRQAVALTADPDDPNWQALPYGGFPNVAKFRRSNY
jgi:lambda family phage minor tail protein L